MGDKDKPKTKPSKTSEETKSKAPGKLLILLIEDDPLIDKMYRAKFASEGFKFEVAQDGIEGLELALNKVPDFIILDIMMPRLSGIDFLEKLRQKPKGKKIPVIVLTNLSEKEEEERAQELGVVDYLVKANVTPGTVVDKIKKHLGSS